MSSSCYTTVPFRLHTLDPMLQLKLLGGFQLNNDDDIISTFESARLQALLAYLVLHGATRQSRQQIAYHFWPVSTESQARTNLRKLFLQLRLAPSVESALIPYDALDAGEDLAEDGFGNLRLVDTGARNQSFQNGSAQIMRRRVGKAARATRR